MAISNKGLLRYQTDNLDRLTAAAYGVTDNNEVFTMDGLGNRDNVNIHDGTDVDYVIDANTNRYSKIGDANLFYDQAGNLITDRDGYQHYYDYENRITEINDVNGIRIAEFAYDAYGQPYIMNASYESQATSDQPGPNNTGIQYKKSGYGNFCHSRYRFY